MKLCWKTHKTLEEFCKTVCTGKIGWNRQRRKDCRNNTMCQECKRRLDAPMHTANIVLAVTHSGTPRRFILLSRQFVS